MPTIIIQHTFNKSNRQINQYILISCKRLCYLVMKEKDNVDNIALFIFMLNVETPMLIRFIQRQQPSWANIRLPLKDRANLTNEWISSKFFPELNGSLVDSSFFGPFCLLVGEEKPILGGQRPVSKATKGSCRNQSYKKAITENPPHAVFLGYGQLYLSRPASCICHHPASRISNSLQQKAPTNLIKRHWWSPTIWSCTCSISQIRSTVFDQTS